MMPQKRIPSKYPPGYTKPEEHYCTQEKAINRINSILIGNGDPESGLAFKMVRMVDNQEQIKQGIQDLKVDMRELRDKQHKNAEENRILAQEAMEKIISFKSNQEGFDLGVEKTNIDKRSELLKVLQIILTIVAVLGFIYGTGKVNSKLNQLDSQDKKIESTIDRNLSPHLNKRGIYYFGVDTTNLYKDSDTLRIIKR